MSKWFRCDSHHPMHHKFEKAGHWGWCVTVACWCIAKEFDISDGNITEYWTPKTLAKWASLFDLDDGQELAQLGMKNALSARLIDEIDGQYFIHNWSTYQKDMTSTERVRNSRANKKAMKQNETFQVFHGETNETDETPEQYSTIQDNTIQDNTINTSCHPSSGDKPLKISNEALVAADKLRDSILKYKPDHALNNSYPESRRESWAKHIDRLNRIDGKSFEKINQVIDWLPTSTFWAPNIQSGQTLREKFDRLEAEMHKPEQRYGPMSRAEAHRKKYEGKTKEEQIAQAKADGWEDVS